MKISVLLLMLLFCVSPACAAYQFEDLPVGWAWDRSKIQGEILPANPGLPDGDPNLWLVPLGRYERVSTTNQWVAQIKLVSIFGSEPASFLLELHHDPDTRQSISWNIGTWSVPDPWYITIDAFAYPGKSGIGKSKRYTIVGCGFLPDDYEPALN